MSSISLRAEVQVETLEANAHTFKSFLCLYENEYLMCKVKNSSNGNGKSNIHVSWSLQKLWKCFHSNITSHSHSKNSLENKMFSFKMICQFSCHAAITKNGCEIQSATPSSLHPLLLWNHERNASIQDTTFMSQMKIQE